MALRAKYAHAVAAQSTMQSELQLDRGNEREIVLRPHFQRNARAREVGLFSV